MIKFTKPIPVIVVTGSKHRLLGVPGEEELNSRGVSTVQSVMVLSSRGKDLLVVGGGDSVVKKPLLDSLCQVCHYCSPS